MPPAAADLAVAEAQQEIRLPGLAEPTREGQE
jgi:hypothetical protein